MPANQLTRSRSFPFHTTAIVTCQAVFARCQFHHYALLFWFDLLDELLRATTQSCPTTVVQTSASRRWHWCVLVCAFLFLCCLLHIQFLGNFKAILACLGGMQWQNCEHQFFNTCHHKKKPFSCMTLKSCKLPIMWDFPSRCHSFVTWAKFWGFGPAVTVTLTQPIITIVRFLAYPFDWPGLS